MKNDLYRDLVRCSVRRTGQPDAAHDAIVRALERSLDTNERGLMFAILRTVIIDRARRERWYGGRMPELAVEHEHDPLLLEMCRGTAIELVAAGFSYQDIADRRGWPIGTVMSRVYRERKRLQGEV